MYQNCCKKCGSVELFTEVKGNNTGLYCTDCGAWIKWLSKDELRAFENTKTQSYNKTIVSDNKTEDSKLELLWKLVKENEDRYYDYAIKAMETNNMTAKLVHSAQAGAFQQVRYTIENVLNS